MRLRKLISFVCCLIFIFTFAVSNVYAAASTDESVIDSYLAQAGFSEDIIEILPNDLKKSIFKRKEICESSDSTYGIFTDEYTVEYTLDKNNNIIIDNENIEELNKFLSDESAVNKVKADKLKMSDLEVLSSQRKNLEKVNSDVLSEKMQMGLISETNWTASIVVNHVKENDGRVTKRFIYWWRWDYDPFWKLVDQVAVSWSDSFSLHQNTVLWYYFPQSYEHFGSYSGTSCDTYIDDKGMAQSIDILYGFIDQDGIYRDNTVAHSGIICGDIERDIKDDSVSSISARYFHQKLKFKPSFTINPVDGVSLDIQPDFAYDKSPDSGWVFYY